MNNAQKKIEQVGKAFEWQIDHVPADYANGYLQAVRDCKAACYNEDVYNAAKELGKEAARIIDTRAPLTARQKQIYDFIVEYTKKNCFPPSVREIGEGVGLASTSSVHSHLKALEDKGYIETKEMQPRAIRIIGYRYEEG